MPKQQRYSQEHQALIARYLTWGYKSTKESFDRLERKATQTLADEFIWEHLNKKPTKALKDPAYKTLVDDFRDYVDKKQVQPIDQAQHHYLRDRLEAIEAAIKNFLGEQALKDMRRNYEKEFTRRIWESREH